MFKKKKKDLLKADLDNSKLFKLSLIMAVFSKRIAILIYYLL